MDTLSIITMLLNKNGKTQKDLTDYLGISKNAFTHWKAGRMKSYQRYLPEIAEFFGVSVDCLLGREQSSEALLSVPVNGSVRITKADGAYTERTLTEEQLDLLEKLVGQLK